MNASAKSPARTRLTLLDTAFTKIHRNGFQAVSLEQILTDIGLTRGARYHHYRSCLAQFGHRLDTLKR